jgi:uncharacterized membrane protein YkvA (DUF1232 family)
VIKPDIVALWIAARDRRTPLASKVMAGIVATYALSPIDLIPEFTPLLGYLDDLLIVPFGFLLAVRLIPTELMVEYRERGSNRQDRPLSRLGLLLVAGIWISATALAGWHVWASVRSR